MNNEEGPEEAWQAGTQRWLRHLPLRRVAALKTAGGAYVPAALCQGVCDPMRHKVRVAT